MRFGKMGKLPESLNQSLRRYLPLALIRFFFPSTNSFNSNSPWVARKSRKVLMRAPPIQYGRQPVIILSGRSHMKSYKKRRFSESISDSDKSQNVKITSELFYDIASLINIHFWAFLSLIL